MSLTLFETFRQIDPYVKFNDGCRITTAKKLLMAINPMDPTEYALGTDGIGRLLVYKLDVSGRIISPPIYVEEKSNAARSSILPEPKPIEFGSTLHGFV